MLVVTEHSKKMKCFLVNKLLDLSRSPMMSFMSQFWVDFIYDWHLRNHPIMKSTLLVNKTHMKIVER